MSGVKILHTGDLHLGSGRTSVESGKAEIENTFFRIINLCKTENVDFLLIAGDLFDAPFVVGEDAKKIISLMAQIPETIIAISPGNHDCAILGSVYHKYEFPPNVHIFSSDLQYIDFPHKNVRLWGAGFSDKFANTSFFEGFSPEPTELIQLCVVHGEVVSQSSESVYSPITPQALANTNFDYVALGHIHKPSDIKRAGNTYYSYCGCPDGMGFDEIGMRGVYLGTVGKNSCNLEYIKTSSRLYVSESVDISGCTSSFDAVSLVLTNLETRYKDSFDKNLYRISLTGTLGIDTSISVQQMQTLLGEKVHYIEISDDTQLDISDLSSYTRENSLRGIFVKKMLSRIESSDPSMENTYKNALRLGLKAFGKGVGLNDN